MVGVAKVGYNLFDHFEGRRAWNGRTGWQFPALYGEDGFIEACGDLDLGLMFRSDGTIACTGWWRYDLGPLDGDYGFRDIGAYGTVWSSGVEPRVVPLSVKDCHPPFPEYSSRMLPGGVHNITCPEIVKTFVEGFGCGWIARAPNEGAQGNWGAAFWQVAIGGSVEVGGNYLRAAVQNGSLHWGGAILFPAQIGATAVDGFCVFAEASQPTDTVDLRAGYGS